MNSKQKRKQRLVKNAIVDTDDVKIEAGINFINWIPIARQKLQVHNIAHLKSKTNRFLSFNIIIVNI